VTGTPDTSPWSAEFALRDDLIYLNHAAMAPWPARTAQAVADFAALNASEGSLHYPRWTQTESALRGQLARLLNAPSPDDIALLKSTSEGLSFVAQGLDWRPGDNVVIPDQEFPSNRVVWEALSESGVSVKSVDLAAADTPETALLDACDASTRLLSVSSVQFATGLRMDLEALGRGLRERGVLFCVDAIQGLGAIRMDVQAIGADFVTADAHKWLLGPEGIAVFYTRPALRDTLRLTEYGWHMREDAGDYELGHPAWRPARSARRFECGSPNMLGIHALHASLSLLEEIGMDTVETMILKNTSYLIDIMADYDVEIVTPREPARHAGIVSFRHKTRPAEQLFADLTEKGVFCALRGGAIRFSPHFYTPRQHLERAVGLLST